jgi:hypothetical protein
LENESKNNTPSQRLLKEFKKVNRQSTLAERRKNLSGFNSSGVSPASKLNNTALGADQNSGKKEKEDLNFSNAFSKQASQLTQANSLEFDGYDSNGDDNNNSG